MTGFIDKFVALSGPELADIKQGCAINSSGVNPYYTYICQNNQLGCQGWSIEDPPFPGYSLEFSPDAASNVELWTGSPQPACANNSTQTQFDDGWLHMSIVDLSGFSGMPSFNYPKTALSAYLCESVVHTAPNNSEAQGQIFYEQFTNSSQLLLNQYSVNAVTNCPNNPEDVNDGTVQATQQNGFAAIVFDMSGPHNPNQCQKIQGH